MDPDILKTSLFMFKWRIWSLSHTLRSQINVDVLLNRRSENSMKYNMLGVWMNGGAFYLFWSQWRKCIKICLCTNKVVIYGQGKKCWSKTNFSDSNIWPGKLKVEMLKWIVKSSWETNTIENAGIFLSILRIFKEQLRRLLL